MFLGYGGAAKRFVAILLVITEIDPIVMALYTNVLGSNYFLGGVEGF